MINLFLLGLQFDSRDEGGGAVCSSEALVYFYWTTQCHIPEDGILLTFKPGLHFDRKDGGQMFLWSTGGLLPDYTAWHHWQ
jgi:hypothetical protein